jgi:hypothetical protein
MILIPEKIPNALPFDIIIPTINNPLWIARCLVSIVRNTDPSTYRRILVLEGGTNENLGPAVNMTDRIQLVLRPKGDHSWLGAMREMARPELDITDHFIHVQDDSLILPGDRDWVRKLTWPMTKDPAVAASVSTVTACSSPHQKFSCMIAPGYYFCVVFAPIVWVGKTAPILACLKDIMHDMTCDQEPWLDLNIAGWKCVMCTNTVQYHESMQSNLRVYGGEKKEDQDAFIRQAQKDALERLRTKYSAIWLQRVDRCELNPMDSMCINTPDGFEVRM